MKETIIAYYEWFDIQTEICKEMGIDEKYFRDYHKLIGGEYKDLWHIWLEYFDEVGNDTIVSNDLGDSLESKLEYLLEEVGEWVREFVEAVYRVWDKYEIEYIKYSW
jgi:hypothetical protein